MARKKRTSRNKRRRTRRNVRYATANRRRRRGSKRRRSSKRRRTRRNARYATANRRRSRRSSRRSSRRRGRRRVRRNQLLPAGTTMMGDVIVPVLGGTAGFLGARALGNWAAEQDMPVVGGNPNAGKAAAALVAIPAVAWAGARKPSGIVGRNQGALMLGLGMAPVEGWLRGTPILGDEASAPVATGPEGAEEPTAEEQAIADQATAEEAAKTPETNGGGTAGLGQFEWLKRLWQGRVAPRAKAKAKGEMKRAEKAGTVPKRPAAERDRVVNKAVRRALERHVARYHHGQEPRPLPSEAADAAREARARNGAAEGRSAEGGGAGAYYETDVRYPGTGAYYETGESMGAYYETGESMGSDYYTRGMLGSGDGLGAEEPEAVSTVIPTDLARQAPMHKQWKRVQEGASSPGDRGYAGGLFARHLFAGMMGQ